MKEGMLKRLLRTLLRRPRELSLPERYPQYAFGAGTYGDLLVHSWGEGTTLRVGAYTSIASGVQVMLGGEHRVDWATTYPFNVLWPSARHKSGHPRSKGDVEIGNDVWIGAEALILSGVSIGDGAVIGARSVVATDIPPYAIAAGNPARVVRYRFAPALVERLLHQSWWTWPEADVRRAMEDLLSPELEVFLARAERGDYRG